MKVQQYLVFSLLLACARGEMPRNLQWSSRYASGNCAEGAEVDSLGQLRGSSGCEERVRAYRPRALTSGEMAQLVKALDRLRATSAGRVAGATPPCRQGTSIRLTERAGQRCGWDFCESPEETRPSKEAAAVIELLSESMPL